jgi:hypothetical protein
MDGDRTLRLRESSLSWRELDANIVVLDLVDSSYLTVSGSGAVIWKLLAQGTTVPEIESALLDEYDVDVATASEDVTSFLADLQSRNLLA